MVLLLWFYLSGFVLLLGAVMNVKFEHAAPIGKQPGEKEPGQMHRIGVLEKEDGIARMAVAGTTDRPATRRQMK